MSILSIILVRFVYKLIIFVIWVTFITPHRHIWFYMYVNLKWFGDGHYPPLKAGITGGDCTADVAATLRWLRHTARIYRFILLQTSAIILMTDDANEPPVPAGRCKNRGGASVNNSFSAATAAAAVAASGGGIFSCPLLANDCVALE